jgi:hypothetical protein
VVPAPLSHRQSVEQHVEEVSPEYEDDEEAALQEEIRAELRQHQMDEEEVEQQLSVRPHVQ